MAETNKSQMLSEAEIIEAINKDSLISVSLGAGQPQKNVKMSTLASVAAGLIGGLFKHRGNDVDANSQLESGLYQNASNCPSYYGMLLVFNSGGVFLQIFTTTDDKYYIRSLSVSGWSSWKQFAS